MEEHLSDSLARQVREMVALGPRLPGTSAHRQFVDGLEDGFRASGASVERERFRFTRWTARRSTLELRDADGRGERRAFAVASAYTYSGATPSAGVEGTLVDLGADALPRPTGELLDLAVMRPRVEATVAAALGSVPGGVRGRIVLLDAPVPPLTASTFAPLLTHRHDPDATVSPDSDYCRAWTTILTLPTLAAFRDAGAAGVVFALDAAPAHAAGQYLPFLHPLQGIPALIVDREVGAELRELARGGPLARLTLEADVEPDAATDSLLATLPGDAASDEVVLLHTHTDGQNAFEENAGIALVELARHFAGVHRSARRRTLTFSAVTGHFGPDLPETRGLAERHPELLRRTVAALALEHLGAREWVDGPDGYRATGLPERGVAFHTPRAPLAAAAVEAMQAVDLRRCELLRPIGPTFFGVGGALHEAGVPTLAYVAGPSYLLAVDADGHLDKLDPDRMRDEVHWAAEVVRRLDRMPA